MNRLTHWRSVLTGWQLGTRPVGDPEGDAVRDHREATLVLRSEVSGLTRILHDRLGVPMDQIENAIADEADWLDEKMAARFPGFRSTDQGLQIDATKAADTMKGWRT